MTCWCLGSERKPTGWDVSDDLLVMEQQAEFPRHGKIS